MKEGTEALCPEEEEDWKDWEDWEEARRGMEETGKLEVATETAGREEAVVVTCREEYAVVGRTAESVICISGERPSLMKLSSLDRNWTFCGSVEESRE